MLTVDQSDELMDWVDSTLTPPVIPPPLSQFEDKVEEFRRRFKEGLYTNKERPPFDPEVLYRKGVELGLKWGYLYPNEIAKIQNALVSKWKTRAYTNQNPYSWWGDFMVLVELGTPSWAIPKVKSLIEITFDYEAYNRTEEAIQFLQNLWDLIDLGPSH